MTVSDSPPTAGQGAVSATAASTSRNPANDSAAAAVNAMTLKTKQEVLTSLHLIKDIRRLETYQRDYFLKVREALSHVQMVLDRQLMDMAWSDNLIDCEETLLKVAVHLPNSSPNQIADLYSILLHDRENLNNRFQELAAKSSISEFVVNSRKVLDIETVKGAAESILKNEKPPLPKPDNSVPVDHTFFLANFCVTSLASGMLTSFLPPKRPNPSNLLVTSSRGILDESGRGGNGAGAAPKEHLMHEAGGQGYLNGIGNGAGAPPNGSLKDQNQYSAAAGGQPPAAGGKNSYHHGMYTNNDRSAPPTAAAQGQKGFKGAAGPSMFGNELVSAITQITRQDDKSSPVKRYGAGQQDPWGNAAAGPNAATAADMKEEENYFGQPPRNGYDMQQQQQQQPQQAQQAQSLGETPSDTISNSSSTATEEQQAGDKPLSFARIASLNLEKQPHAMAAVRAQGQAAVSMAAALAAGAPPSLASVISQQQQQQRAAAVVGHPDQASLVLDQFQNQAAAVAASLAPLINLPPSNNPRFFFDIAIENKRVGRAIIEVQPQVAPRMAQNFQMLVTGEKGFSYRGCHFFQAWKNESVICGDWEHNSGRGGRAAIDGGPLFIPDETKLPCIRGAVGMRRMSKKHSTQNQVASQFRVILANMNTQFTGIFGQVIYGLEVFDKVANIGGDGGRPEKVAMVQNCGIYKV